MNFTSNAQTSNAVVLESNPCSYNMLAAAQNNITLSSTTLATGAPQYVGGSPNDADNSNVSQCQWCEDGTPSVRLSAGPLDTFKLILNGQDRFKEQKGKYFNQIQPYYHHSGCPYPGIYSYSFALKPEEHQPTGTCNFSRIDNAQVQVTLKSATTDCQTLNMFATNYNVLRIQSGMGGLAFSN